MSPTVSIIIPVFNKLAYTRQCLDRVLRHTRHEQIEVVVVDNGSTDGTHDYFTRESSPANVRYVRHDENLGFSKAINAGAALSESTYLLLLNNDTLVQPSWLEAMLDVAASDRHIGIVGIKQLFPYTNRVHHVGMVIATDRRPVHLYPHIEASAPQANLQRDFQAVNGACLLISRELFTACGGLDEGYRNGYEDVDLCLRVRQRQRRVVCCTNAFIYHYGQISETRTERDEENFRYFDERWRDVLQEDEHEYRRQDAQFHGRAPAVQVEKRGPTRLADHAIYFADSLAKGSALTWFNAHLAQSLIAQGAEVHLAPGAIASDLGALRSQLEPRRLIFRPVGGVQIKWSHYWREHLESELAGALNLELFVINYHFERPDAAPWDYWLQSVAHNGYIKLPLSGYCQSVLGQLGIAEADAPILHPGYAPEIDRVAPTPRAPGPFKLLTVTNSHDLERYGTRLLLDAYDRAFSAADDVVLVVKDYGVSAADTSLLDLTKRSSDRPRIETIRSFTSKDALIALYRSCDAFVSAHRGEGFAMKVLDAMACGLPTIAPRFGGPADYLAADNCLPVDFSLVPMGDCLDTRSLAMANRPTWAEVNVDHLAQQMRWAFEHRDEARALGEHASHDVRARFTWEQTARALMSTIERFSVSRPRVSQPPAQADRSPARKPEPRITVVIPTFNRRDRLLQCLDSLRRQSILFDEFEVVVVDDGSTDGTADTIAAADLPFRARVHQQQNGGPGRARNAGVALADADLVLFIDDDIVADARLLEAHLIAHATRGETVAILGHVDWPPHFTPNEVMQFVCGVGHRQFAYDHIPNLPALDFRFFYTSNISLKRQFLLDAARDGVQFDGAFRHAAYEDSEFAYRLSRLGLEIVYDADARAYHDSWMDLESFSAREYKVGQMAVVMYRKHPGLDALVDVAWLSDFAVSVQPLAADQPRLAELRQMDAESDQTLRALAASLESDLAGTVPGSAEQAKLRSALYRVFDTVFETARTRGKVEEWYAGVTNENARIAARTAAAVVRKLEHISPQSEVLASTPLRSRRQQDEMEASLRRHVEGLQTYLGTPLMRTPPLRHAVLVGAASILRRAILRKGIFGGLRRTDAYLVSKLRNRERWLSRYLHARNRVRRRLM